jgi:hypothetical protein
MLSVLNTSCGISHSHVSHVPLLVLMLPPEDSYVMHLPFSIRIMDLYPSHVFSMLMSTYYHWFSASFTFAGIHVSTKTLALFPS